MKLIVTGNTLNSQTIVCSNVAQGISRNVYTYIEETIYFIGNLPIKKGDVIQGAVSGVTAIAVADADIQNATGTVRIKSRSGDFSCSEILNIGAGSVRLIDSPVECEDKYPFKGIEADHALITVFPKNSFRERGIVFLAWDGSTPDHNSMLGHPIKDGDEVVLNHISKIKAVRFLEFTAGSKAIASVSCSFPNA